MRRASRSTLRLLGAVAMLSATLGSAAHAGTYEPPPPPGSCSTVPLISCTQSEGKLKLDVVGRTIAWKWTGRGVDIHQVLNPTVDAIFDLCVYDATGTLVVATGVPPASVCHGGVPCWRARPWGYQYRDRAASSFGIDKIVLRVASRRDRLSVSGAGALLPLPVEEPALPLTVQLVRGDEQQWCWSSVEDRLH